MRELSEATLAEIESVLDGAAIYADHFGARVRARKALAEFREWRAGREKATEPGECEACIGTGKRKGGEP